MNILLQIVLASVFVSLIAIIAVVVFLKTQGRGKFKALVSLAAGILLAFAFLDLLPEALNELDAHEVMMTVLATIVVLFLIENVFHWHHCRHGECEADDHSHVALFNLVGDGLHNFVDGVVIASTFMIDPGLGIAVTVAVILHEIPQELADVGVLLYSGLSKKKVILFNFLFALTALVGAVMTYYLASSFESVLPYLLAIVAGNFIYLSLSDLVPMIHHESRNKALLGQSFLFVLGVVLIYAFSLFVGHGH